MDRSSRRLWERRSQSKQDEDYVVIFTRFSKRPPTKSFLTFCSNSVVVVQEICLTVFLLARHRIEINLGQAVYDVHRDAIQKRIDQSTVFIFTALAVVLYYSSKAERVPQQTPKAKIRQRAVDGLLLAVLLRFLAGLLQSLTASYSSDTVQALARFGMLIHVFACDYTYANGKEPTTAPSPSRLPTNARPPFQGGTISLNAAFFATTLLVSRLSSNLSAYFFVSVAIAMFAFYPATRSAIAASFPASSSGKDILNKCMIFCQYDQRRFLTNYSSPSVALWMITAAVYCSAALLLERTSHMVLLSSLVILVGAFIPYWKYTMQSHKILLPGPWDIPTASALQLDCTRLSNDN